jgi:hypothetical protein
MQIKLILDLEGISHESPISCCQTTTPSPLFPSLAHFLDVDGFGMLVSGGYSVLGGGPGTEQRESGRYR